MAHEICYIEIITGNLSDSMRFYQAAFDWQVTPTGGDYAMFQPGDGEEGGFSPPMPGLSQGVCIYIKVDDIDQALARIVASGGQVVQAKRLISVEYGYYGLFRDNQGNVLGVWSKA